MANYKKSTGYAEDDGSQDILPAHEPDNTAEAAEDTKTEEQFLEQFLAPIDRSGPPLPFKSESGWKAFNNYVVQELKDRSGNPVVISTPGCFEICGTKLQFIFERQDRVGMLKQDGFVVVRRNESIAGKAFKDMFIDSAFDEDGLISSGGTVNVDTGKKAVREIFLMCRPFAAHIAQLRAQSIASGKRNERFVDPERPQDRVLDVAQRAGLPEGYIKTHTASAWTKASSGSANG